MKNIAGIIYTLLVLAFVSCNKFLEEPNKAQASVSTVAHLRALLDNITSTSPDWVGIYSADYAAINSTDDVEINLDAFAASPGLGLTGLFHYTFDADKLIQTSASDPLWSSCFERILTANVILSNVDQVSGSELEKNAVKADAYFNRAYAYWILVNHYCEPYSSASLQALGLPLRTTTSFSESLSRASLKDTYDLILSDITQAATFVTDEDVNPKFRWRVSKKAIDAFLSRYYLFIGDYAKSIDCANRALTSVNVSLMDFNNIKLATNPSTYRPNGIEGPAYTVNFSELSQWSEAQYVTWQEFFLTSFTSGTNSSRNSFNASPSLIANYDLPVGAKANDLRYKLFMPDHSGFAASWTLPGLNSFKQFGLNLIPTGPTIAEVMLNKAEASARLGDFSSAAMLINALRAKRLVSSYANINLQLNASNALTLVLQERRRELPFAFRWYDIRRFAYNDTGEDDVVVSHSFYNISLSSVDLSAKKTYTLPLKSTHYKMPIPNNDIIQSQGQIQQNNY